MGLPSIRSGPLRRVKWGDSVLKAALVSILLGALYYFFAPEGRILVLFFLFLPVVSGAGRLGSRAGLMLGAGSIAFVLLPVAFAGPAYVSGSAGSLPGGGWALAFWAALLLLTAQIAGWAVEHTVARHSAPDHWEEPTKILERERTRMGLDLHDGIAQTVSATLMEIELLEVLTSDDEEEVREQVARLKDMCTGSLREIRTMVGTLRPAALSAPRFREALERLTGTFERDTGAPVELLVWEDLQEHSDSMRICTYRVLQEALSNIQHHADAGRVRVELNASSDLVSLEIDDDGNGFYLSGVTHVESHGHMGLTGMKERVELLGGSLDIESTPGKGTLIRARIPARSPARRR